MQIGAGNIDKSSGNDEPEPSTSAEGECSQRISTEKSKGSTESRVRTTPSGIQYKIINEGDEINNKFHQQHQLRRLVLEHNIGEQVVIDNKDVQDFREDISNIYLKVVGPLLLQNDGSDRYCVIVKSKKLNKPLFLGNFKLITQ